MNWGTHQIQTIVWIHESSQGVDMPLLWLPNQQLIPTLNFPLLRLPKPKIDSNAWFSSYKIHLRSWWCKSLSIGHLVARFLTRCPHHQAYRIFLASHTATSPWPNYYYQYTSEKSSQLPRGSRVRVKHWTDGIFGALSPDLNDHICSCNGFRYS